MLRHFFTDFKWKVSIPVKLAIDSELCVKSTPSGTAFFGHVRERVASNRVQPLNSKWNLVSPECETAMSAFRRWLPYTGIWFERVGVTLRLIFFLVFDISCNGTYSYWYVCGLFNIRRVNFKSIRYTEQASKPLIIRGVCDSLCI